MEEKKVEASVKAAALTGKEILIGHTMLEIELAEALGVSKATVQRLRYEGLVPYVKISNGKPIYLVNSILEWLKRKEINEGQVKISPPDVVEKVWSKEKGHSTDED